MFAVSTCWKSAGAETGTDIIRPMLDAGIAAVELEYRITEEIFREMLPGLKRGEPAVVSIHNFFPLAAIVSRDQASGDAFLLSSPEKEERELAVRYTIRTLEHAHEVGATAVVLHLGKTDMDDGFRRLKGEYEGGTLGDASTQNYVRQLLEERKKVGGKHLEAALFSLDKLWRPAERLGIKLGIENRYHLKEVPDPDELGTIFEKFEGSNIAYWHDVGHAAVQELLYGVDHEPLLSRFSSRLAGIHLHDAEGVRDHQAPGKGKMDFEMVKKYITTDTIRVIEVGPEVSAGDLRGGVDFLFSQDGLLAS
ncbi:MAG: sugar phosphate isomerase/epimerase [Candidatus Hydrogenedentota bacterium]|nr:MAG: sugar phosphate isomerase/epimerase [Candidatus Hydrogenedentota bacterium]